MDERDERLTQRIRAVIGDPPALQEKRMFGGIGFLVRGNMACGVNKGDLIVRLAPGQHVKALSKPHVKPFDMTGRPMKGWIVVTAEGYRSDQALREWVRRGVEFALSLPPK